MSLWHPGVTTFVPLYEVVSATCGMVMMAWLEDPLEVVDSTASPRSKATQVAGVSRLTMLGQLPCELPVRMAGDHLQWKDTNRSTPSRGSYLPKGEWHRADSMTNEGYTPSKVKGQEMGAVQHCGAICKDDHSHKREAP